MIYFYIKLITSTFPIIKIVTGALYAKLLNVFGLTTALLWFARINSAQVPADLIRFLVILVFVALITRILTALIIRGTYVGLFKNN